MHGLVSLDLLVRRRTHPTGRAGQGLRAALAVSLHKLCAQDQPVATSLGIDHALQRASWLLLETSWDPVGGSSGSRRRPPEAAEGRRSPPEDVGLLVQTFHALTLLPTTL